VIAERVSPSRWCALAHRSFQRGVVVLLDPGRNSTALGPANMSLPLPAKSTRLTILSSAIVRLGMSGALAPAMLPVLVRELVRSEWICPVMSNSVFARLGLGVILAAEQSCVQQ
jgi:hypothetical protein